MKLEVELQREVTYGPAGKKIERVFGTVDVPSDAWHALLAVVLATAPARAQKTAVELLADAADVWAGARGD